MNKHISNALDGIQLELTPKAVGNGIVRLKVTVRCAGNSGLTEKELQDQILITSFYKEMGTFITSVKGAGEIDIAGGPLKLIAIVSFAGGITLPVYGEVKRYNISDIKFNYLCNN